VFLNCGQICLGTERVYVQREIFERFVRALRESAETLKPGHPSDKSTGIGPSSVSSIATRCEVLPHGDRRRCPPRLRRRNPADAGRPGGRAWVQPTIWTDLPESSRVVREEIFGPCCHIAPFSTEDEALALANDTPYGLARRCDARCGAKQAHGRGVAAGIVWINSWFLRDLRTPFGGSKLSGTPGGGFIPGVLLGASHICVAG